MAEIHILQQSRGAQQAVGLTVIIDVFRAFTTACQLIENGAVAIIPVARLELAEELMKGNADYVLIGERNGITLNNAAFGNSPAQIKGIDFSKKTIVFTTSAGTKGFESAHRADELITGSFANAKAVTNYIKRKQADIVSLVCMGYRDETPSDEDTLCAEYIKASLLGKPMTQKYIIDTLKDSPFSSKFFDCQYGWALEEDFYLCTALDRFSFVLKLRQKNNGPAILSPKYS